jgi:hypothetical protein
VPCGSRPYGCSRPAAWGHSSCCDTCRFTRGHSHRESCVNWWCTASGHVYPKNSGSSHSSTSASFSIAPSKPEPTAASLPSSIPLPEKPKPSAVPGLAPPMPGSTALPNHSVADRNLRGTATLITAGKNKTGCRRLRVTFPSINDSLFWHEVDRIYNKFAHLSARGTTSRAQEELKRIYPWYMQAVNYSIELVLEGLPFGHLAHIIVCASGHHRSVAHAEIIRQELNLRYPNLNVLVMHLDHTHEHTFRWDGSDSEEAFEKAIEAPIAAASRHPPRFLLHNWFGSFTQPSP